MDTTEYASTAAVAANAPDAAAPGAASTSDTVAATNHELDAAAQAALGDGVDPFTEADDAATGHDSRLKYDVAHAAALVRMTLPACNASGWLTADSFQSMTALVPDPMKPSVAKYVLQTLHATQTKYVPDPENPDPAAVRIQEVRLWQEPDVIQAMSSHLKVIVLDTELCKQYHSKRRNTQEHVVQFLRLNCEGFASFKTISRKHHSNIRWAEVKPGFTQLCDQLRSYEPVAAVAQLIRIISMGVSGDVAVADLRDDLRAAAVATASANMDVDALMGLSGSLAFALEEEVPQCPAIISIVAAFALAASAERHSARGGVDIEDMLKLHVGPTYQAHILALLVAGILAPMPASSADDGRLAIDHPTKRRVRVGYFQQCLPVAMSLVVRLVATKAYPFGALKQVLREYMTPQTTSASSNRPVAQVTCGFGEGRSGDLPGLDDLVPDTNIVQEALEAGRKRRRAGAVADAPA